MRNWFRRLPAQRRTSTNSTASALGQSRFGRRSSLNIRTGFAAEPLEDRRMLAVFTVDPLGGGTHTTIQAAVNAASATADGNDVINVVTATYAEAVVVNSSANLTNLVIASVSGIAADVVIDPPGVNDKGFEINDDNVTLRNLTVTGAGIGIEANSVTDLHLINVHANTNVLGVSANSVAGTLDIQGGTYSTNTSQGLFLEGSAGATLSITPLTGVGTVINNNATKGMTATLFDSVTISGATVTNHADEGIELIDVGAVVVLGATATDNQVGMFVNGADSFSDLGSNFSDNDDDGLHTTNVGGLTTLTGTTASGNGLSGLHLDGDVAASVAPRLAITSATTLNNGRFGVEATDFIGNPGSSLDAVRMLNSTLSNNTLGGFSLTMGAPATGQRVFLSNLTMLANTSGVGGTVTNPLPGTALIRLDYQTSDPAVVDLDAVILTTTDIQHTRGGVAQQAVGFAGIGNLGLDTGLGADTINVRGTLTGTSTIVDAGGGDDTVSISSDAPTNLGNMNGIQGSLAVRGGVGNDQLNFINNSATIATSGFLYSTLFAGLGMGAFISYNDAGSDIETLDIQLGSGDDLFGIVDLSAVTTLRGGNGNEFLTTNMPLSKTLNYIGQGGDDWLSAYFTSGDDLVEVTSTTVSIGASQIVYSGMEVLDFNLLDGNDTVRVAHVNDITTLPGIIRVHGFGGANDKLVINGTTGDDVISVSDFFVAEPGRYQVETIEAVQVFGDNGNDVIKAASSVNSLLNGGLGNDFITGSSAADVIFGSSGFDFILAGSGDDYIYADDDFFGASFNENGDTVNSGPGSDTAVMGGVDSLSLTERYLGTGLVLDAYTQTNGVQVPNTPGNRAALIAEGKAKPWAQV